MTENTLQVLISGLSTIVWGMTAYIFMSLRSELRDLKDLLNKVLLEHTVLKTNYSISQKDIQVINDRLFRMDKDVLMLRERNHDTANALSVLWNHAIINGWKIHSERPTFRADQN